MMATGNGPLSVPPGFRFHPTDEELLYYYLRKKVSYEAIDLDVIREVDLNKLEPWDLKDKCRIGSGPQNEWYFFSHKDKKYPTGTRTNRATTAGFWKATGRDKAIHLLSDSKRIGMRKTLVFYTGRAPHGQKTDWIMHEYRLDEQCSNFATSSEVQEEGWVVCRVFKKKNHNRNPFHADDHQDHSFQDKDNHLHLIDQEIYKTGSGGGQSLQQHALHSYDCNIINTTIFDSSMHLPQLLTSPHDQISYFLSPREGDNLVNNNNNASNVINTMINNDMGCPRNLLSLMSASRGAAIGGCRNGYQLQDKSLLTTSNVTTDWSFLDKLLTSHQHHSSVSLDHHHRQGTCNDPSSSHPLHHPDASPLPQTFPFQYLGYETDILKFSK